MEIKLIQTQFIPLSKLEVNKGQVEGIPSNPRRLDDDAFAKLKKSIEERPGMLALRELCVYPHGNKFVVLGGNMRLLAMRELKYKEAPCKVIPEDTPLDELKAFVVVDNSSFGAWDYDALANEWDDLPLQDWGVPAWEGEAGASPDDFGEDFKLPDGDKSNFCTMSFQVSTRQRDIIEAALKEVKQTAEYSIMDTDGNNNSNGNALALIIEQYGTMQRDTN